MMFYFRLAWRNLWRNKRRTAITLASIFFAVILSSLMMSLKEGTYENMIKTTAGDFSGFVQVHADGYWEEKTMDYFFEFSEELKDSLSDTGEVDVFLPRIESFALAEAHANTKGSIVIGIDPELEKTYSKLDERVFEGSYFAKGEISVLVGKGLADYMEIAVGDTLVLLGQGYRAVTAAGKYAVKGIVKFGSPELSKQIVFLPLEEAQRLFGAYGLINNLVLKVDDAETGMKVAHKLDGEIPGSYEVMGWEDLYPDLVNMIETDRVEGYVFMFIMYMVIAFGIFGTMLMMMAERRHEFGVLIAIGMKRLKLAFVVFIEVFVISVLGAMLGILGAYPVCYYFILFPIRYGENVAKMAEEFGMEPVLRTTVEPAIFLQQATVIAIIAIIIGIYPFISLSGANAVDEMNS